MSNDVSLKPTRFEVRRPVASYVERPVVSYVERHVRMVFQKPNPYLPICAVSIATTSSSTSPKSSTRRQAIPNSTMISESSSAAPFWLA